MKRICAENLSGLSGYEQGFLIQWAEIKFEKKRAFSKLIFPVINNGALALAYFLMKDSWSQIPFIADGWLISAIPYLLWITVLFGALIFVLHLSQYIKSAQDDKEWTRFIKTRRLDISTLKPSDVHSMVIQPRLQQANISGKAYREL
ncbi:hypothetical protein P245_24725 [Comamonas thiooxydans]|uniref:Uncharacterized protein n=1 Tax=Comamonas thiooxydans TaxID=363952 RepID=A0A0E3B9T8_9BURK|nr:hypothetical protein P245_24725 [Comamonas thiooxydans]